MWSFLVRFGTLLTSSIAPYRSFPPITPTGGDIWPGNLPEPASINRLRGAGVTGSILHPDIRDGSSGLGSLGQDGPEVHGDPGTVRGEQQALDVLRAHPRHVEVALEGVEGQQAVVLPSR